MNKIKVLLITLFLKLSVRADGILFHKTGERVSILVVRTAPGLGNVTVDWTVEGPFVHRTVVQTSGKLFFTEVKTR